MDQERIFRFLQSAEANGERCALVSLVRTTGGSMRSAGAHMAVSESGDFLGSLSGGCIEQAVASEAVQAIGAGEARVTRYGAGSPFIDIRLPCGGGVDVHIQPWPGGEITERVIAAIDTRQPFGLDLGLGTVPPQLVDHWQPTDWDKARGQAQVGHWPTPKVLTIGQGENVTALVNAVSTWNATCEVATQEAGLAARLTEAGIAARHLTSPAAADQLTSDPWTAIVILFHDHDWEVPVIKTLIGQPYFYFGVMGSKKTHERRRDGLMAEGVSQEALDRLCAPIGLIPGSRDPATLAVSILAEIVDHHRQADFRDAVETPATASAM